MTATGEQSSHNDHTPGPWTIQGSSINNVERRENICQWHVDIDKQPADHQANARLIAAAPDLLAALEYITSNSENMRDNHMAYPKGIDAAPPATEKERKKREKKQHTIN